MAKTAAPSLQDFSLVETKLRSIREENTLKTEVTAFYYFVLDQFLSLQDDEVRDSITDNAYQNEVGLPSGHDRGIDAVYIDTAEKPATIHFFNCKYTGKFDKTKDHFPAGEIDKIDSFLRALLGQDKHLKADVNAALYSKVEEIWGLFKSQNPNFILHICGNLYNKFEKKEGQRFERLVQARPNFAIKYHMMPELVRSLTKGSLRQADAKVRAMSDQWFGKDAGDIQSLILTLPIQELLRIVIDDAALRDEADLSSHGVIAQKEILEDVFDENIRPYLKQRTSINKNIKRTALAPESSRFFYFNNGITLTCEGLSYNRSQKMPLVELRSIQVVNGGQTIHALHEAFKEDQTYFSTMEILCRIYKTENRELRTSIAEYTNSQNPVNNRDIRSLDDVQIKLETEFRTLGYYYERKKRQHAIEPRSKRIDAERAGQVLMAFYHDLPGEAKNEKRFIFNKDKYYSKVFSDEVKADKILVASSLFDLIEAEKAEVRSKVNRSPTSYPKHEYLFYASYYLLWAISKIAEIKRIDLKYANVDKLKALYTPATKLIQSLVKSQKQRLSKSDEQYSHASFFKYSEPKDRFEELKAKGKLKGVIESKTKKKRHKAK